MTRDTRNLNASADAAAAPAAVADLRGILASIGLVPYDWRIDTDTLIWGANVADVLRVADWRGIATGRGYAGYLDPTNASTRYDAVMQSAGRAIPAPASPIRPNTACRPARAARPSSGSRTPAAGSPAPTAGRRARTASCASSTSATSSEQRLAYLSRFDALTGEMNRSALTEMLEQHARRGGASSAAPAASCWSRSTISARINESYGFDIADEVIARGRQAHPRPHARRAIMLGRFSGNKFGVVLNELHARRHGGRRRAPARRRARRGGADRRRPVAVDRDHRRRRPRRAMRARVDEILARAQEALDRRQGQAPRLVRRLSAERRARGAAQGKRARRPTRSSPRSTSGASCSPSSRWSTTATRAAGLLRMPDAHPPRRRHARARRSDVMPVAEQLGLVRLLDHRVLELVLDELVAAPALQRQPQRLAGLDHRSRLVGGARRACCARIPASPSA